MGRKLTSTLWVLAMALLPYSAFGACGGSSPNLTAASAGRTDVAACVTLAVSGDTINVPSGSATWASEISFTKAISLTGAGLASTTLTCSAGCIAFAPSSGEETKVFEVTRFHFIGNNAIDETGWGHTPAITGLKVHDNNFTGATTGRAVFLGGLEFGAFYSNTFSGNFIAASVIDVSAATPGAGGDFQPFAFGSSTYPYFEDDTFGDGFGGEFVTETGQGGRLVLRHNTVNGYNGGGGGGAEFFDIHGEQGTGGWTNTSEIYHNSIINTGAQPFRWINQRGGQMVIANNSIDKAMEFQITQVVGNGSTWGCFPYPVGSTASETNCTVNGTSCLITQVNNSFYFNNNDNGSNQTPSIGNGTGCGNGNTESTYIQQNREFWMPTFGLEAALPGTCTANGNTYYGTTDTDKIYKCTSANAWTVFYQPYTYPHPLRSSSCTAGTSVSTCASSSPSSGAASLARKLRKMLQPKAQ